MRFVSGVNAGVDIKDTAAVVVGVVTATVDLTPAIIPKGRLFIWAAVKIAPLENVVFGVAMLCLL
jgi:hypothetical protein